MEPIKTPLTEQQFPHLGLQNTCKALGVTPPTVYNWVKTGVIPPPLYLGEKPYWSIAGLESFMKEKSICKS